MLHDSTINWARLKELYEFESQRVSGPGSYYRDINDVLWSLNEFILTSHLPVEESDNYRFLLEQLAEKNELLTIIDNDRNERYLTRVAEVTRLLGHNYEYYNQGRQSIDSIRWLIEEKKIPERNIQSEVFLNRLLLMVEETLIHVNYL